MLYRVNDVGGAAYWVRTVNVAPEQWTAGTWQPGIWREHPGPLVPGLSGLHLARPQDLPFYLGPEIWEAEADGAVVAGEFEVVTRRARITRQIQTWDDPTARAFAMDCLSRMVDECDSWRDMPAQDLAAMLERDAKGSSPSGQGLAACAAMTAFRISYRLIRADKREAHRQWASERLFQYLGVAS